MPANTERRTPRADIEARDKYTRWFDTLYRFEYKQICQCVDFGWCHRKATTMVDDIHVCEHCVDGHPKHFGGSDT